MTPTERNYTLTVIVPAYNVEDYIGETLDSLAAQSPPFDEIIIIDDNSTDGTITAIQSHPYGANVRLLTIDHRGVGPARNAGIEQATSDYIYFLDSDDTLDPAFTQVVHDCIARDDAPDLILFSGKQFLHEGDAKENLDEFKRKSTFRKVTGDEAIGRLAQTKSLEPAVWLYVSRKSIWINQNLRFKPILHEDEEILFPLMLAAKSVTSIVDSLYYRRVRAGSIMSSKTRAHCDGLLTSALTAIRIHQTHPIKDKRARKKIRQKAIRHTCRYMRTCHKAGVPIDFKTILEYARTLKSPDIILAMVIVIAKSTFTKKADGVRSKSS